MAKVISISFRKEKEALVGKLEEIARLEGKTTSEVIVELLEEFVKKHSRENSQTRIESFYDSSFEALPDLWRLDRKKFLAQDNDTKKQIIARVQELQWITGWYRDNWEALK